MPSICQVGPAEPGVPPGDVVRVHDSRSGYDVLEPSRPHPAIAQSQRIAPQAAHVPV